MCEEPWTSADTKFMNYYHKVYEPQLIASGKLGNLFERFDDGTHDYLYKNDPVYRRACDLIMDCVDYSLRIGKYKL